MAENLNKKKKKEREGRTVKEIKKNNVKLKKNM